MLAAFSSLCDSYEKESGSDSNSYATASTFGAPRNKREHLVKLGEKEIEPPSSLRLPIFMIGRDSRGNWVALAQGGARGGLFVDRAGALKFAKSENGNQPHAIVWVSGILELDAGAVRQNVSERRLGADLVKLRLVA
jgi:hypothetical protein